MIFQAGNEMKVKVSSIWKKKKIDRNSRIRTHDPDDLVSFTALKKKEPNQFRNSV